MTILEIEYFKGDTFLYGRKIGESELKQQINKIEKTYDKEEDNFVELLCRRFAWQVLETDNTPNFTYDRDIAKLYTRKIDKKD